MSVIHTGRTGTSGGINTSSTGAEGSGGGGESYPLLTGLVGWSLTGGPQQTLSSAGVIASGPYDLTNNNSVTFGANGAVFGGTFGAYKSLTLARNAGLDVNGGDFALSFIAQVPNADFAYDLLYYGAPSAFTRQYGVNSPVAGLNEFLITDPDTLTVAVDAVTFGNAPFNTKMHFLVYMTGGNIYISINGGTADSTAASGVIAPSEGFQPTLYMGAVPDTFYGEDPQLKMLYPRLWKGDITAVIAANSWLANLSGGVPLGRTDAEIAAYTG